MDIFTLKALMRDLRPQLVGAAVSKIFQMSADDLLLRLWRRQDHRLLISTHRTWARLHLTNIRFDNPKQPPRFAAHLRAHLQSARLIDITVEPYERIVSLKWERREKPPLTLVHELLGAQSNLILVDAEGIILDALKRIAPKTPSQRPIEPGQHYQFPLQPAHRRRFSDLTLADLVSLRNQALWDTTHLKRLVIGVPTLLATELLYRSQGDPRNCWALIQQLRHDYEHNTLSFHQYTLPNGTQHLSPLPLTHLAGQGKACDSAQMAVAAIYNPVIHTTLLDALQCETGKRLRQRQRKLRKKIDNLRRDKKKLHQYLAYQRYGTLLLGQQVPRGATHATVIDYYSPDQATLTIPLDQRLSVQDNAESYFKKYRKAKTGLDKVGMLLSQCAEENAYLDALALQIDQADDWPTLQTIDTELGTPHPQRRPPRTLARPKSLPALPYRTFTTHDGATLYCGKNSQGNDALLKQLARPHDLWFHAHLHAGTHVLLKTQAQHEVPYRTLIEAAALAAFYSKGQDATNVEVIYTQAKHIRKFRGARPGQVQVTAYRTLEVVPGLPQT